MFKRLIAFVVKTSFLAFIAFPFGLLTHKEASANVAIEYYVDTFIISAYYSPVPGQEKYVTGSYEGDIYLNGGGVQGADGTPVYPGMIAAPKSYAFGTKMNIPGVGIVAVHDRGGAIVEAGVKGHEHDRLDIWMGYGDKGLTRALNWGKRTVQCIVYGVTDNVQESIYLEGYSEAEKFFQNTILAPVTFPADIYYGTEGDDVKKMQGYLKEWGYLDTEANGFYGDETANAVFLFQLDNNIVNGADELGAGHFGLNTRRMFDTFISRGFDQNEVILKRGSRLMEKYTDLKDEKSSFSTSLDLGAKGSDVSALQEELAKLGFLRIDPTGYYGEVTQHAVFKFQQSKGLVASSSDSGAGYFGPATRDMMNSIILSRFNTKSLLAYQREQIRTGRHLVKIPSKYYIAKEEE